MDSFVVHGILSRMKGNFLFISQEDGELNSWCVRSGGVLSLVLVKQVLHLTQDETGD